MDRIALEKIYLEKVKKAIAQEREEQKNTLERIPFEYKGRYAQVKWGDEDLVKSLTEMYIKRLINIKGLEQKPYFGSFEFSLPNSETEKFYIGKTDLSENKDILVLDWRNPICTLYYDQSKGNVSYEAPSGVINGELKNKSQILIENGELISVKDVDLVSDDELLQPFLSVNADNKMKVIIASIQAEQNNIIRKPITENFIVQGVAGSGKSSVAAHRPAYLTYNLGSGYDASKFAIIGPNKYFLNYLSSILPDLDSDAINEFTFEEVAQDLIKEDGYEYQTSSEEMDMFLKSKNKNTNIKKIKGSLEYKDALTKFLNDYFDNCLKDGIWFEDIEIISSKTLKNGIIPKIGYFKNANDFIKILISRIKENYEELYYDLSKKLMLEMKSYPLRSEERNNVIKRMDELRDILKKGCASELRKFIKPIQIKEIQLYKIFLNNIEKYIDLDEESLKKLKKDTLSMINKKVLPYEDLAAISYLNILSSGLKNYDTFKHVTIDEAQDYSLFQFYILKTLFKSSNFSIYGDLAQAIYSHRSINNWEEVKESIFNDKCEIINMNKSYRTTKEITDVSNLVLEHLNLGKAQSVIRTGYEVSGTSNEEMDKETFYLSKISDFLKKGYKSIGIICKTEEEIDNVSKILNKLDIPFHNIKSFDKEYNAGISLLTSYLSKGLEFDAVIINNASEENFNSNSTIDMHLLYVSMTRALHELNLLYDGKINNSIKEIKDKEINEELILKKKKQF